MVATVGRAVFSAAQGGRPLAPSCSTLLGAAGGRKGGRSTSDAKRAASRQNGKLGGRPRKVTQVPQPPTD